MTANFGKDFVIGLTKCQITSLEEIPSLVKRSREQKWDFPEAEEFLEAFYGRMKWHIFVEHHDDVTKTEIIKT